MDSEATPDAGGRARSAGRLLVVGAVPLLHSGGRIGADELIPVVAVLIVVLGLTGLGVWVVRGWKDE